MSSKNIYRCGHCNRDLGRTAFWEHRTKFFDVERKQWIQGDTQNEFQPFVPSSMEDHTLNRPSNQANDTVATATNLIEADEMDAQTQPLDESCTFDTNDSDTEEVTSYESIFVNKESIPYEYQRCIKTYSILMAATQAHYSLSQNCLKSLLQTNESLILSLASLTGDTMLPKVAECLPKSVEQITKMAGLDCNTFETYAVCTSCNSTYKEQTLEKSADTIIKCNKKEFPNHPNSTRRKPCGNVIAVKRPMPNGSCAIRPVSTYSYQSIRVGLARLLPRLAHEIIPLTSNSPRVMFDIVDAPAISEQMAMLPACAQRSSTSHKVILSLLLNIDWFQPYKHIQHSVGAIYLSVNNLPRHLRYKPSNIILLGIIPGPREPHNINSFILPIVDELTELQHGEDIEGFYVQAFLSCTSNDNPAARKLCGFSSHTSSNGCYKCSKVFTSRGFGKGMDCSGYDYENWAIKTKESVLDAGDKYLQAKTQEERKQVTRETGFRYSVLNSRNLPYFDPINDTVIDPMHTLFLGIAKRIIHQLQESHMLDPSQLQAIQDDVNSIRIPSGITTISRKISSGFSSLTADQWKIWTLLYSTICMHTILPPQYMSMLQHFSAACTLMCSKVITVGLCQLAKEKIVAFAKTFQLLFGDAACVPNMHFACHIPDSLLRFGPAAGFWLFSFERYNGILGEANLNHKAITQQLMRHFLRLGEAESKLEDIPEDMKERFTSSTALIKKKRTSSGVTDSLDPVLSSASRLPYQLQKCQTTPEGNDSGIIMVHPKEEILPQCDIRAINEKFHLRVAAECLTSRRCNYNNITYTSASEPSKCNTIYVLGNDCRVKTGTILNFVQTREQANPQQTITLAKVNWHEQVDDPILPFPWTAVQPSTDDMYTYITVREILSRAAEMNISPSNTSDPSRSIAIAPVDMFTHIELLNTLLSHT